MPPVQLEEIMYRILRAQQANIARIVTDLVLEGTTGTGEERKLWGPTPDVIRIYDTPLRFVQDDVLENLQRVVTLAPLTDSTRAQIVTRNDRNYAYLVHFWVRLTELEQSQDRDQVFSGGTKADNPLAQKAHRLVSDFHYVFHDDLLLETAECPNGLVNHASYEMSWDSEIEYPQALFTAEVSGWVDGV